MSKKLRKTIAAILCTTILLSACSSNTSETNKSESSNTNAVNETSVQASSKTAEYDDDDFYINWANRNPNYIKFDGSEITLEGSGASVANSTVTIAKSGIYVISGTLGDGQIIIDAEDDGTVNLVLNGAEINCSYSSPVYAVNAKKVVISLQEGTENLISDGKSYTSGSSEDDPNSAIFSMADLSINGSGKLTVNGNYNNAITSKDDLKITGGRFTINSSDDALMGRDMIAIKDGSFDITSVGKGLKTTNDTDTEKGNIFIDGGTFSIKSTDDAVHSINGIFVSGGDISVITDDDAVHADSSIEIAGGKLDIAKCYEGIESSLITISGGDISLISSDDGVNVSGGNDGSSVNGRPGQNNFSSSSDRKLNINGGNILINSQGDGLDANGSIYMTAGTVVVNGPTSNGNGSVDYDGEFNISGGTLITAGSSGMAMTPSTGSVQNSVMINFNEIQKSGTSVHLQDSSGKTVVSFTPQVQYQSILMSSPDIEKEGSYSLLINDDSTVTFVLSKSILKISESGEEITGGGIGQMGGMRPEGGKGRPDKMPPDGQTAPAVTAPDSIDAKSSATVKY